MSVSETDVRVKAYNETECLLCVPEYHENCEKYTTISVCDLMDVPLGESAENHLFEIPICALHFEAIKQYQKGKNVDEIQV